tara:strand:- start:477 stop:1904 length:1428 start_codon:yes stop_codon:yes gene_type:complete
MVMSAYNNEVTTHSRGGTGQLTAAATMKYGSLSEADGFTIQKKFLAIAKRNMVFARFAQKETKSQNDGLEVRWRRYEKFTLPLVPLAEGLKPPADSLTQTTIKCKLHQYGSYVNTTDVLVAAATDPVINQIVERQSIQAAELMDYLSYLHFRTGTQAAYAGFSTGTTANDGTAAAARYEVNRTIGNTMGRRSTVGSGTDEGTATSTELLDIAIRTLENNEATKIAKIVKPSASYDTSAIPDSYFAVCHPDLRQDIEDLPGFVPYQKYANGGMQSMNGELGAVGLIRFIMTTQASPFGFDPDGTERKSTDISITQGADYVAGFENDDSPTRPAASSALPAYSDVAMDVANKPYGETGNAVFGTSGTVAGELGADMAANAGSGARNAGHTLITHRPGGSGSNYYAKVYPVIIFASDCVGCVSLSGFDSVIPKVVMPQPAVTDPLGQSGSVGWKSWYACKILQENWIYRLEVGCSSLG